MQLQCPKCKFPILENYFFCPNCGKKLKNGPLPINIEKQIGLYLISFLVPPFGLLPGVRYLLQKDNKRRVVGVVCIVITIISLVLTAIVLNKMISDINKQLNSTVGLYQDSGQYYIK